MDSKDDHSSKSGWVKAFYTSEEKKKDVIVFKWALRILVSPIKGLFATLAHLSSYIEQFSEWIVYKMDDIETDARWHYSRLVRKFRR